VSTEQEPHTTYERWRPTTKQIIGAVIAVVVLIAILQNTRTSTFSFLFFDFEAPVWICVLVTFGAGVATGLLVAQRRARRPANPDVSA
jgi:uncharacterized integral membrane protein